MKFLRKKGSAEERIKAQLNLDTLLLKLRLLQIQYTISRLLHSFAAEGGPLHTAEGQENQGYNRQLEGKKPQWVFSHRINLTVVGHNLIGAESWIPHRWAGSRPPPDSQGEVSQVYPPGRTWPVQRKGSKNWQNVNWEAGRQESKR